MSRDIKFRAVDKRFPDKMIYGGVNKNLEAYAGNEHMELMEYTGLKDKHSKEVYEGDVVLCASSKQCPHEIVWTMIPNHNLGGMPGFYLSGLNEGYSWMGEEEVIGNVWEHPELLKEEKNP